MSSSANAFAPRPSIAYISPGDRNCPSVELRKPIWQVKAPSHTAVIEGTIDIDARFFQLSPHPSHPYPTTSPFAITVALLSSTSMSPLDWNQEHPAQCSLAQSTPNPLSNITIHPRVTIDEELCCVEFEIVVPPSLLASNSPSSRIVGNEGWKEFGVAVKAYDATGRVTQTNIANFAVMFPKALTLSSSSYSPSPASSSSKKTAPTSTSNGGLARRVSKMIHGGSGRRRSSAGSSKPAEEVTSAWGRHLRKQSVLSSNNKGGR